MSIFRLAVTKDINDIMGLIHQAQVQMKNQQIPQWQDGYPNQSVVIHDVKHEVGYVLEHRGKVIGYGALIIGSDPNYQSIQGNWLLEGHYATIHRFVIDPSASGHGYGSELLSQLMILSTKIKADSLRIDTHHKNIPMLRLIHKSSFTYCGIVQMLDDHTDRDAFEKKL